MVSADFNSNELPCVFIFAAVSPTTSVCYSFQVSHHPPVSAFYVSNRKDGFCLSGSILAKSKFYGTLTQLKYLVTSNNNNICSPALICASTSVYWLLLFFTLQETPCRPYWTGRLGWLSSTEEKTMWWTCPMLTVKVSATRQFSQHNLSPVVLCF